MKKYKYYLGQKLVCESTEKVKFTKDYPAIREQVEVAGDDPKDDAKKKSDDKVSKGVR